MTLSLALDSIVEFCAALVASGKFTQAQVHRMAALMRTGDILVQRWKVVEDVELKLIAQANVPEKEKTAPSKLWATAQESELIPNTGAGIMGPSEQRAAQKQAKAKGLFGGA